MRPNVSYFKSIDVRRVPVFEQTLAAVFLAKRHEGLEIDNPKAERLISEYMEAPAIEARTAFSYGWQHPLLANIGFGHSR